MIEALLAGCRFFHFAALTVLFGATLFPLYAGGGKRPAEWDRHIRRIGFAALAVAVVSGAGWFAATTAGMNGALAAAGDLSALKTVLSDTPFGALWTGRAVLAAALLTVLMAGPQGARPLWPIVLSGLLLASLALTGHTQAQEGLGRAAHESADALHLLAAGAWIGGLVMLSATARPVTAPDEPALASVLTGFSGMGYLAVAVLVFTGLVNSAFMLLGPLALLPTAYGETLGVKLILFIGMCALAAANRFWISPGLVRPGADPARWTRRLHGHVAGEQALGALVLLAVGMLGTFDPHG